MSFFGQNDMVCIIHGSKVFSLKVMYVGADGGQFGSHGVAA